MSLINDALKRARDVDRNRGTRPPTMSMKPVEPAVAGSHRRSKWLVVAFVIGALALSLWSFLRWANSTPPPPGSRLANAPETPVPLPSPAQPAPLEERSVASMEPAAELRAVAEATNAAPAVASVVAESLPDAAPVPVDSAEPPTILQTNAAPITDDALAPNAAPELRLQSIIFRSRNPTVIINGQWLAEGESIADAKILRIEPHQVTLRWMETNLVLQMPRY